MSDDEKATRYNDDVLGIGGHNEPEEINKGPLEPVYIPVDLEKPF